MKKYTSQKGSVLTIVVMVCLTVLITLSGGISAFLVGHTRVVRGILASRQSFYSAESSFEYFFRNIADLNGDLSALNVASSSVSATISGDDEKIISSVATTNVSGKAYEKNLQATFFQGTKFSSPYVVEAGDGGINIASSSVSGNVFSTGMISGIGETLVAGTVISSGSSGSISGVLSSGNIYAHTIKSSNTTGKLYCANGSGNSKQCEESSVDPASHSYGISQSLIDSMKDQALQGGVHSGNLNVTKSTDLGGQKIQGDLDVGENVTIYISGPLWVTGNVRLEQGSITQLSPSLKNRTLAIISDGKIVVDPSTYLNGSGAMGSYIALISGGDISYQGSGNALLFSRSGEVELGKDSFVRYVGAYKVSIAEAVIQYEKGLQRVIFPSSPNATWSFGSWQEINR